MEKRPRSGTSSQDAVPVPNETKKLKLASHSTGSPIRHSATRRTNKDYTVGWICAITTEYVAAKCFLDERHEVPDQVTTHDNNNYTLGMIGKHNVVIAALPFGEYGISSAASVARDMVHTFPNIRIGLMVGVGGGAPGPGHDIRLGDVVVGVSRAGKGSVCQYDFGEAIQGQGLKETAYLNQPPALLRTAVSGLIAQYQIEGHRIQEAIDNTLKRYPRLQKKYKRPESNTDRLYLAKIVHPLESNIQCTIHCGDDLSCFKDRPERGEDEDNPTIHFGLIASANTLMRDAIIRDAMVKEKGVLCFETEAAGLMNHFPCLVIRGICDYSDSHKNDEWQGYAAMTAAAYTADLLRLISPNKVEAERKISEILEGLHEIAQEHLDIAKEQLQIQKDQDRARFSEKEEKCHQLFRLATNEKDATYEWYKDRIEERVPGTCLWFLEHEDYQKWLKQKYGPLLVTADPGCGKSVLAKYLIDEGLPRSETICYFFFKDQDQNTVRQALCAVLHQLFSHKPSLIKYAINQFSKDGHGLANSTESLWKVLESATSDPEAGSITIVFDALDECAEHEFPNLLRNMNTQLTGTQHIQLKYVLTCRPYEQIMSRFRGLFTAFPNIHIPGEENSEIISQEVNCVITHRVNRLSEKHQLTDNIKSHLEERLRSTSNRTYLWVHLVFNYLESTGFKQTQTGIDMSVSKLPKSINEAYEQILNRSAEHSMVRKALCVILAYKQPITISEMNIAMSIDFTLRNIHDLDIEDDKSFISRLRSWCGLFISIHHGKLYFLHQTAREFLLKDSALISQSPSMLRWQNSITTHETHTVLTEICLLYLELFSSKFEGLKSADDHEHHLTDKDEFLTYSAWYWMDHFRKACIEDNAAILSLALKVYDSESMNHKIWRKVYGSDDIFQPDQTELHIASLLGHTASVKFLINNDKGIGKRNKDKKTPLHYASSRGCCPILELLLNNGADIEAKDINEQTPLSCAAQGENIEVVEMLLNRGADIEAKDETGCTPLSLANQWGTIEIIKLLLNKGADIETKANTGRTPLFWAVIYKAVEVPELLLNRGADIEAKDNEGRTPLSWAARYEGFEVLKLLISWSADIEARDNEGRTPLSWAAAEGTVKGIVNGTELLLSRGADIEARDNEGRTPLSWAAAKGTVNRTKLLLDSGADIEARDNEGRTPLSWATLDGSVEVTELLLNRGADIDAEDHEGRTPLYWASDKCVRTTVSLLLKKGARIDTRYWDSATMLEVAKSTWIEEVIDLLSTRRPIVIL